MAQRYFARYITPEEIQAEALPASVDPVMVFDDNATGRHCAWVKIMGQDWLLWKHPDGQWVTWRKLSSRDHEILDPQRTVTYNPPSSQSPRGATDA